MQEWSSDSKVSAEERNELILNLSRSLWNLHMARHRIGKIVEEDKLQTLASASCSTEITTSHGHATTNECDEIKGIVVPNTEVNLSECQYEQSVKDAYDIENEYVILDQEVEDSIEGEMLKSIFACGMPMGIRDASNEGDSSDLGFLVKQGSSGLSDGGVVESGHNSQIMKIVEL